MLLRGVLIVHTALGLALALSFASGNATAARTQSAAVAGGGQPSAADDEAFLAAREAASLGNRERFGQYAARLRDHPLQAYVELWRLQLRLRADESPARVAPDIEAFLTRHAGAYVADRLRVDWLTYLGSKKEFEAFGREAPKVVWGDDGQLRCLVALNNYQRNEGRRIEELGRVARQVLAASRESGGDGCWALTEALLVDERVTPWERMRALVEQNQLTTAKRLVAWLPKVDAGQVAVAIEKPAVWLSANERNLGAQKELALVAIARMARDEPTKAARFAALLDPSLTPQQKGTIWGRIGHMAAFKHMPEAVEWYRNGGDYVGVGPEVARADEVLEWQVRAALRGTREGPDWTMVRETVERMPPDLRNDPAWVYWHARAIAAEGRRSEAWVYLRAISNRYDFYGRLAAEELELPYAVPARPQDPTDDDVAAWQGNAGFARAIKFYELGLRVDGNREWSWQLRGRSDRELLAAAEYGRRVGLLDRMIAASERTRESFDVAQRYPAPHREDLTRHAQAAGLDETWVYGLIRQESRFIQDARSTVGAQGLMQLMPATARYMARRVGMNDFHPGRVVELETNLRLGTNYLRLVFDDLDGHPALATAAYNAGPNRARTWRSTLPRAVEGAIFAETIPFNETRDYVKKVMANAVTYAVIFDHPNVSLKTLMGSVTPKTAGASELP